MSRVFDAGAELARHGYVELGISASADGGTPPPPGLSVVYGVPTQMPLGSAGPACYMLFTEDRGGALLLQAAASCCTHARRTLHTTLHAARCTLHAARCTLHATHTARHTTAHAHAHALQ